MFYCPAKFQVVWFNSIQILGGCFRSSQSPGHHIMSRQILFVPNICRGRSFNISRSRLGQHWLVCWTHTMKTHTPLYEIHKHLACRGWKITFDGQPTKKKSSKGLWLSICDLLSDISCNLLWHMQNCPENTNKQVFNSDLLKFRVCFRFIGLSQFFFHCIWEFFSFNCFYLFTIKIFR